MGGEAGAGTPGGAPGAQGTPAGGQPGGGASAEWKSLMSSPAYFDDKHADHRSTVDKVNALGKEIFGEGPADAAGDDGAKPLYATVPRPHLSPEIDAAWPADVEKMFRQTAHEAGLTDAQMKNFLDLIAREVTKEHKGQETARKAGIHALRQKWGEKLEARMALADDAIEAFSPTLADKIEAAGLFGDPDVAEVFATLGESMKERGLIVANVDGIQGEKELRTEIKQLMRSDPYFDSNHKNHAAVVEAVNKLSKKLYGEQPVGQKD
jgi:hypothetical protein